MHTHTYTYIHTYTHIHTHTYTYTHTYIHTHIYIHTYVHTHTYIHTHKHTYTHTYIHKWTSGKMADDVLQGIKDALNKILNTTDQSGNMKKELKKNFYETVSALRNLVNNMQVMLEEEIRQENPN